MKKVVLLAAAIVMGMTIANAQEPVKKEAKAAPQKVECQHKCNHKCNHGQEVKAEAQKAETKTCCDKKAAKPAPAELKKCEKAPQPKTAAPKEQMKVQPAEKKVNVKK